jgi:hypothetical protein
MDAERASEIVSPNEDLDERSEHGEVIVFRDVRLLRCRDERVCSIVEVAALEGGPGSFTQVIEVVEHEAPLARIILSIDTARVLHDGAR